MIVQDKLGGRTVFLYLPFDYMGKRVESITISPMKFGHTLLWNEGHYRTMLALLVDMAGVDEAIIRELRYPDADRVFEAFTMVLTPAIREDINNGVIPTKPGPPQQPQQQREQEPPQQYRANGGAGQPVMGPGDPLPLDDQPGFDMSDEAP